MLDSAYSAHHELSAAVVVSLAGPGCEAAQQDLITTGDQRDLWSGVEHYSHWSTSVETVFFPLFRDNLCLSLCLYGIRVPICRFFSCMEATYHAITTHESHVCCYGIDLGTSIVRLIQ